jgi:hypothetical protein
VAEKILKISSFFPPTLCSSFVWLFLIMLVGPHKCVKKIHFLCAKRFVFFVVWEMSGHIYLMEYLGNSSRRMHFHVILYNLRTQDGISVCGWEGVAPPQFTTPLVITHQWLYETHPRNIQMIVRTGMFNLTRRKMVYALLLKFKADVAEPSFLGGFDRFCYFTWMQWPFHAGDGIWSR